MEMLRHFARRSQRLIDRGEKVFVSTWSSLLFVGLGLAKVYEYCKSEPSTSKGGFGRTCFERYQRSKGRPAGVGLHQFRLVGRPSGNFENGALPILHTPKALTLRSSVKSGWDVTALGRLLPNLHLS